MADAQLPTNFRLWFSFITGLKQKHLEKPAREKYIAEVD